jgi:hypothetical protein
MAAPFGGRARSYCYAPRSCARLPIAIWGLARGSSHQRIATNRVAGAARLPHVRDKAIDAKAPEVVEAIRATMRFDGAVLVRIS